MSTLISDMIVIMNPLQGHTNLLQNLTVLRSVMNRMDQEGSDVIII